MYTGTRVIISNPGSVFDGKTGRTTYKNARKNGGIEVVFDEPLVASGMSFKTCYFGRKELVELNMEIGTKVIIKSNTGVTSFEGVTGVIESVSIGKDPLYRVKFDEPIAPEGITDSFFTKQELQERDVTVQNQKF